MNHYVVKFFDLNDTSICAMFNQLVWGFAVKQYVVQRVDITTLKIIAECSNEDIANEIMESIPGCEKVTGYLEF